MQDVIKHFRDTQNGKTSPTLGQIRAYAGENIPDAWLPCDRRLLRRQSYPELFRALGTQYGDSDGSNTAFNLPGKVSAAANIRFIIFVDLPNPEA